MVRLSEEDEVSSRVPLLPGGLRLRTWNERRDKLLFRYGAVAVHYGMELDTVAQWLCLRDADELRSEAEKVWASGLESVTEEMWAIAWSGGVVDSCDPRTPASDQFASTFPLPSSGQSVPAGFLRNVGERSLFDVAVVLDAHRLLQSSNQTGLALPRLRGRIKGLEWSLSL